MSDEFRPRSESAAGSTVDPVVILPGESGSRRGPAGGPGMDPAGLEVLAHLLDSAIQIPGTNLRIGLDALLGVIPGLGDVGTSLLSILILREAQRRGVSKLTMIRMTTNLLIDAAMGSIPILGDAFDIYWKANNRNVALLRRHVAADSRTVRRAQFSDRAFFALLIVIVLTCLSVSLFVAFTAIRWIATWLFGG